MADAATLTKMRKALAEVIPAGGSATNTNFTDEELSALLTEAGDNFNKAVAAGWLLKKGLVAAGNLQSYNVGGESYTFVDKASARAHCQEMYEEYLKRSRVFIGGYVAGTSDPAGYESLMGGKVDAE